MPEVGRAKDLPDCCQEAALTGTYDMFLLHKYGTCKYAGLRQIHNGETITVEQADFLLSKGQT